MNHSDASTFVYPGLPVFSSNPVGNMPWLKCRLTANKISRAWPNLPLTNVNPGRDINVSRQYSPNQWYPERTPVRLFSPEIRKWWDAAAKDASSLSRDVMAKACAEIPAGVDTAEDLERVRALMQQGA